MKLFYLSIIINCSVNFVVCFAGKYLWYIVVLLMIKSRNFCLETKIAVLPTG